MINKVLGKLRVAKDASLADGVRGMEEMASEVEGMSEAMRREMFDAVTGRADAYIALLRAHRNCGTPGVDVAGDRMDVALGRIKTAMGA